MKSKYEISIWTDIYDEDLQRFKEVKEIIIGSDIMTSENRARNAKLINNIDGTNKFSFDLYYRYIDTRTGEEVENPYVPYLVNERKIKVLWKDEWYDLLIKDIKEDQAGRVFSYTCEDSYITELSRSGFELVFATELENSIGTARELIESTVENTDWQFDEESDQIYQLTEEPVYVATLKSDIVGIKCPDNTESTLSAGKDILIYYSFAPNKDDLKNQIQVRYTTDEKFKTNVNEMLVINGDCYNLIINNWNINNNKATAIINGNEAFTIDFEVGLSDEYRAERYVDSQQTVYSDLVGRYVNIYNKTDSDPDTGEDIVTNIYGYPVTEYNDALAVVNLVTNASNFTNISGWSESSDDSMQFKIWPAFNKDTEIKTYVAKSFLRLKNEQTYINSGIQDNRGYISNGFIENEEYIMRIHAVTGNESNPSFNTLDELPGHYITSPNAFDISFGSYFEEISNSHATAENDYWIEYIFKCIKSCSYNELIESEDLCKISIAPKQISWLEEVQFYVLRYGEKNGETVRINPNELDIQSVAQVVWKYFDPAANEGKNLDTMTYLYTSTTPWEDEPNSSIKPAMNDYISYAMIEESQSNRFNILQSIAEKFKCWVRFRTVHDQESGAILYDETTGLPQKYVGIFREAGQETGIGFIYGIDLMGVTRNIKSNQISTKTIVLQNDNEFGKNGFCTIARSQYNYPKENTIFNFDYYIQHGLLSRAIIQKDLYGTTSDSLSYYTKLHNLNTAYETNLDIILNKRTELTRQESSQIVYQQYLSAAKDEKASIEDTIMKLAGASNMEEAQTYISTHYKDTEVQSLADDLIIIDQTITTYTELEQSITSSIEEINKLLYDETIIDDIPKGLIPQQEYIIERLNELNTAFYKKYARFIQEGTWTSEDYWDDDLYYLDALQVAYESSRPKITYEINVLRLSETEEYSSKIFKLGDISYIQDVKYFGYLNDEYKTPYKERVVLTEITSFFDTPDKDTIKVQNYKNQFDDLFQRITAATQNLEFSEGKYARVSDIMADDGTIKSSVIQKTFESNKDLVYGAQNESVTMDQTGITVVDDNDANKLLKITSGGVFVSADGGENWRNAVRGDGINTDLLTAGRINTENITVYNGEHPSFRWDSDGINAYGWDEQTGLIQGNRVVRFDQYGVYGLSLEEGKDSFVPTSEDDVYENAKFGLTWNRFFMRNSNNRSGANYMAVEISTDNDIVIRQGQKKSPDDPVQVIDRVHIGRLSANNYGMEIRDSENKIVFLSDSTGAKIAGWNIRQGLLESNSSIDNHTIRISSSGSIGSYGGSEKVIKESVYKVTTENYGFTAVNAANSKSTTTITYKTPLLIFTSTVGALTATYQEEGEVKTAYTTKPPMGYPEVPAKLYFIKQADAGMSNPTTYYILENNDISVVTSTRVKNCDTSESTEDMAVYNYIYERTYYIKTKDGQVKIIVVSGDSPIDSKQYSRYVPAANTEWYIDQEGQAVFHNIYADGGQIAGWWIDNTSLYQTYDGTSERNTYNTDGSIKKVDGNVKSQISATGAQVGKDMYSIITDAINAAMATLGGVILSNGLVNGYNIASIAKIANEAKKKADSALTKSKADTYYASKSHQHKYTYYSYGVSTSSSVPSHYHKSTSHTDSTR